MKTNSRYRRYLISVLALSLGSFLLPAVFVLLVDPFQIFHRHFLTPPTFMNEGRFQVAGLVRTYLNEETGYKSMVLGTSLSQNFLPSRISTELGWPPTLQLTLPGGTAREIRFVAEKSLQAGVVRTVLWEVHVPYLHLDIEATHDEYLFPTYLYNDVRWDDLRYLFNADSVRYANRVLQGRYTTDLDRLVYWMDRSTAAGTYERFSDKDNLEGLDAKLRRHRAGLRGTTALDAVGGYPQLDANLLPVLKAYPDVQFRLYLPPVSTLRYALMTSQNFAHALSMRRYLLEQIADLPNVQLFAFDTVEWITGDLANYRDFVHFRAEINDYMLASIRRGKHRLTRDNIESYEGEFARVVGNYLVFSSHVAGSTP